MSVELIYAMSTREKITLPQFSEYFKTVIVDESSKINEDVNLKHQMIRVLDSLGYCEFDFNNNVVYMCPPTLILLPIYGLPKALLVGARTPSFIKKLKESVKKRTQKALLTSYDQSYINFKIPPAIYIEATCMDVLHSIAGDINSKFYSETPAAWTLAKFSESISDIKNNLLFEKRSEPNWKHQVFNPLFLKFVYSQESNRDNFSLVQYRNPINQQLLHLLWDGQKAAESERDWGRYIVLSKMDINVLLYDKQKYQLAVPMTIPLPNLLARALALCTGLVPISASVVSEDFDHIPSNHPFQIYKGVTPEIASLVAKKIGQKIIETTFEFDSEEILHV